MRRKIIVGALVVLIASGCATTGSRTERAIKSGTTWGAVGAAAGALIGVAGATPVGRAAALGALVAGVPAMGVEMVAPEKKESPLKGPSLTIHLPGKQEIYISGYLRPEVKWEVVRELRNLNYQVSEKSSVPLYLRIKMRRIRDPKYIALVYLVDRPSGRILAQGRGEVILTWVTQTKRLAAQKEAVITAIRSMQ